MSRAKLEALANLPQTLEKFTQEAVQRIGGFIDEGNASKAALLAAGSAAALAPQEAEAGVVRQAGQIVHDLLSPVSASKMVGDEKIILDTPDLKIFQADPAYKPGKRESYRYVSYSNGVPVSALQIGTSGPRTKKAVIQNVRTDEPYQRQGHASKLLQRARQDFDIKHSTDLTDDGKAWAKSVGAAAGAGVLGAGALAPQEAEAGPLSAGIRTAFDDRFLNPTGGGNPRVKLRDKSAAMETTVDPRALDIGENVNLQDFEGSPYILTQSDRSAAGGLVTSVHNTPISPVDLRGGRDFMFDPLSDGQVWASDPNVVKSLYNRSDNLSSAAGSDTILLPYTMAPTGIDFATMPVETQISYAREAMSKANIKKLNSKIKKIIPDWGGVENPDSVKIFRDVKGPSRKAIADLIDKDFRDVPGGMSISEARLATSDSAQYLSPEGQITNVGRVDNTRPIIADSGHPTYVGGLPGEGVGRLNNPIDVRPFMAQNGRQLTGDAADIRALSMNHGLSQGIIDSKLLKSVYGNADPRLLGAIAIGSGTVVGSLFSGDADAGPINIVDPLTGAIRKGIEAYHGSPHKFDKFSMDNIGTGEGAQAYGHGLYFADNEDVAKGYRDGTGSMWKHQGGQVNGADYKDFADSLPADEKALFNSHFTDTKEAIGRGWVDDLNEEDNLAELMRTRLYDPEAEVYDEAFELRPYNKEASERLAGRLDDVRMLPQDGSLYRTELDIDPDTMLDWDKPLSEQSDLIVEKLRYLVDSPDTPLTGATARGLGQSMQDGAISGEDIVGLLGGDSEASRVLSEAGIPGVRYLDGNSRSAGEGSSNYVVFDPSKINIKERGMATPAALAATAAAGGAGMAMMGQDANAGMASIPPALDLSDIPFNNQPAIPRPEEVMAAEVNEQMQEGRRSGEKFTQLMSGNRSDRSGFFAQAEALLGTVNGAIGKGFEFVGEAAAIPVRGVLGANATLGSLAAGQGLSNSLQAGANRVNAPLGQSFDEVIAPALDLPLQGLMSSGVGLYGAATGDDLRTISQDMGAVINNPLEVTANRFGEATTDKLTAAGASPEVAAGAGALVFAGSQMAL